MNINSKGRININWILFVAILLLYSGCSTTPEDKMDVQPANRSARIEPDYSGIVIPPNIAPLNFSVREPGQEYFIKIRSKNGDAIRIQNSSGKIQNPFGRMETAACR
jgi:hypothetical protein